MTSYRASRNRFSAISFHDYLHCCGIFLAHFLMEIDRNIISSLQYGLLTLHASWLVWCLNRFCQRNKKILFLSTNQVKKKASRKETRTLELWHVYNFSIFFINRVNTFCNYERLRPVSTIMELFLLPSPPQPLAFKRTAPVIPYN